MLIIANPSTVFVNSQNTTPTIWLGVEDDFAEQIKAELGSDYNFVDASATTLVDDINRRKILDDMPDAIIGWNKYIPNLAVKNLISPIEEDQLNSVHASLERGVSFFEVQENSQLSATVLNNTVDLYGYPIAGQSTFLLTNPNLIDTSEFPLDSLEEFTQAILQNNDQTSPDITNKIFGMGFGTVIDPMLFLYYGFGGQFFQNDILDTENLVVNEEQSLQALGEINTLVNERNLNPKLPDLSDFELFTRNQSLVILLADFNQFAQIGNNASLGPETVGVYDTPSGAPVYSYSVMVPSGGDPSTSQSIFEALTTSNFQASIPESGLVPVSNSLIDDTSFDKSTRNELKSAYENALDIPLDPKWNELMSIAANELTKMKEGDQNHTRTALAIEIAMKIVLPGQAQWGSVPDVREGSRGALSFGLTYWLIGFAVILIGVKKTRSENEL